MTRYNYFLRCSIFRKKHVHNYLSLMFIEFFLIAFKGKLVLYLPGPCLSFSSVSPEHFGIISIWKIKNRKQCEIRAGVERLVCEGVHVIFAAIACNVKRFIRYGVLYGYETLSDAQTAIVTVSSHFVLKFASRWSCQRA